MRIAVLGATSQIARDLVLSFAAQSDHELMLFARRPAAVTQWLLAAGLSGRYAIADFRAFAEGERFDLILNFVGAGNPAQIAALGASIFDVTLDYDRMALDYLRRNPRCRYVFLSSGAAYGANFDQPADAGTAAVVPINNLQAQDWYAVAKLHAECRHRSLQHLPIIDVRVFNYFSHTQDMSSGFLMTDILRAIRSRTLLQTSPDYIVRDYVHPSDFYQLVGALLAAPPANTAVDCYSKEPIDKPGILAAMQQEFGLHYEIGDGAGGPNPTGCKPHYYSLNRRAADFGYRPTLTSLQGLTMEMALLSRKPSAETGQG